MKTIEYELTLFTFYWKSDIFELCYTYIYFLIILIYIKIMIYRINLYTF